MKLSIAFAKYAANGLAKRIRYIEVARVLNPTNMPISLELAHQVPFLII
ncbi:MAG: hypothetical protein AAF399_17590 [Bacteroidota bacterium]